MISIRRSGRFNVDLLTEELIDTFPQLIVIRGEDREAAFYMSFDDERSILSLSIFVDIDERALEQVLANHDPNAKSYHERRRARLAAVAPLVEANFLRLGFTPEQLDLMLEVLGNRVVRLVR